MIKETDIIQLCLDKDQVDLCKVNAMKSSLGGVSRIHTNRGQRQQKLYEDQLTGQIGEMVLSLVMYNTIDKYVEAREKKNKNPHLGDGGYDMEGIRVDSKASLIRYKSLMIRQYHLWIREKEAKPDWAYVLMLVDLNSDGTAKVYVVGWNTIQDDKWDEQERRYEFKVKDLRPLGSLKREEWEDNAVVTNTPPEKPEEKEEDGPKDQSCFSFMED